MVFFSCIVNQIISLYSWFELFWLMNLIMQIFLVFNSSIGLVLFGSVVTGFISRMENIEVNSENALMVGEKCLTEFRRLKKGFGPYLLAVFSAHTLGFTLVPFLAVYNVTLGAPIHVIFWFPAFTLFMILPLLYIVLLAEDAYSRFQDISTILRFVGSFKGTVSVILSDPPCKYGSA